MTASPIDTAHTSKPLADQQGAGELAINHVGVVGLGHMGHAFAVNLIEDGYQVMVFDRNPERTTAPRASGASAAHAAGRSCRLRCDVVLTSLSDDDALAAVALGPSGLVGIQPGMPPGTTCSPTSKDTTIVSGFIPASGISPPNRQSAKPLNPMSTKSGEGQGQHSLGLDPPLELSVQTFNCIRCADQFPLTFGNRVKVNSLSPASSRLSATARHFIRHLRMNALRFASISTFESS